MLQVFLIIETVVPWKSFSRININFYFNHGVPLLWIGLEYRRIAGKRMKRLFCKVEIRIWEYQILAYSYVFLHSLRGTLFFSEWKLFLLSTEFLLRQKLFDILNLLHFFFHVSVLGNVLKIDISKIADICQEYFCFYSLWEIYFH